MPVRGGSGGRLGLASRQSHSAPRRRHAPAGREAV